MVASEDRAFRYSIALSQCTQAYRLILFAPTGPFTVANSTLLGSIATFLTAKLTNALAGEVENLIPGGWIFEGLIASTITFISGILWINFCETVYRKRVQVSSVSVV